MNKEDTISFIRSLLISRKSTYYYQQLLRDFENETGYKLPSFGYKSQLDFLKSIPTELKLTGSFPSIEIKLVENEKSAHISTLVKRQNKVGKCHRKKISHISNFHSTTLNTLEYNKHSRSSNQLNKSNKRHSTSDYFKSECRSVNSDKSNTKVAPSNAIHCNTNTPMSLSEDYVEDEDSDNSNNNFHEITRDINGKNLLEQTTRDLENLHLMAISCDEYVNNISEIPAMFPNCESGIPKKLEISISEVYNPHKFSFQLVDASLINLMNKMQSHYNTHLDDYKIPVSVMQDNMPCAALFQTNSEFCEWHRAVILKCTDKSIAVVQLIDYGTVAEVEWSDLRFLLRCFGDLPLQCCFGRLSNVRPSHGKSWPIHVSKRFLELVFQRNIIGRVMGVSHKPFGLELHLFYTNGVDIGSILVEEELAVFVNCEVKESSGKENHSHDATYLDVEKIIHPEIIGKSRKARCHKNNYTERLSYTENNEHLKDMFLLCS